MAAHPAWFQTVSPTVLHNHRTDGLHGVCGTDILHQRATGTAGLTVQLRVSGKLRVAKREQKAIVYPQIPSSHHFIQSSWLNDQIATNRK